MAHRAFHNLDPSIQKHVSSRCPLGMGGIYIIGHKRKPMAYIGKGGNKKGGPCHRIERHLSLKEPKCIRLHNAIACDGRDAFCASILAVCPLDELNAMEVQMIALHNTMKPNGYNLTMGGDGGALLSDSMEKRLHTMGTPEAKQQLSTAIRAGHQRRSEASKRQQAERRKATMKLPDVRAKLSESLAAGRKKVDEEKRLSLWRDTWKKTDPMTRTANLAATRSDPEYREALSIRVTEQWKNPIIKRKFESSIAQSNVKKSAAADKKLIARYERACSEAVEWPSVPKNRVKQTYYRKNGQVGVCGSDLCFVSLEPEAVAKRRRKCNATAHRRKGSIQASSHKVSEADRNEPDRGKDVGEHCVYQAGNRRHHVGRTILIT